jgi:hypothetical protein
VQKRASHLTGSTKLSSNISHDEKYIFEGVVTPTKTPFISEMLFGNEQAKRNERVKESRETTGEGERIAQIPNRRQKLSDMTAKERAVGKRTRASVN